MFNDSLNLRDEKLIAELPGPILVIGVSGFIGANLFAALKKRRDDVFGLSKNKLDNWRLKSLKTEFHGLSSFLFYCDITQLIELKKVIQELRPQTIFNLAAHGTSEGENNWELIQSVNYHGLMNLLKLSEEYPLKALVNAGSSSEYGKNCAGPLESDELIPNSDYSLSKIAGSLAVSYFGSIKKIPCNHLRLYSVYGPWENRQRLIPKLMEAILNEEYPPFANPETSRDFLYIDDCLRAFFYSAALGCSQFPGAIYNVGTGVKTTLRMAQEVISQMTAFKNQPRFHSFPNRKWDEQDWFSNSQKIFDQIGFRAEVSFRSGLMMNLSWEKEFLHRKQDLLKKTLPLKKITAIVACYKDNQAIPLMYQRLTSVLSSLPINYEIIFVNDGSPLNDEEVIKDLTTKDFHVLGISHSRNFGSQSAFMSGMMSTSADAVVLLDGDLQDPPELIAEFYHKWQEGFQVVYGQRVKRKAGIFMQINYKLFYRLFRWISDIEVPLDAGDFSLIDKVVVKELLGMPEKDLFIRGMRAWVGFRQTGVAYHRPERVFGVSTNNFIKNVVWAKKGIFSFSTKPLEYIQRAGILLFVIGFILGIVNREGYSIGHGMMMMGGVQILMMGILGDYIGKTLEEVKARPRYIVKKKMRNGIEE